MMGAEISERKLAELCRLLKELNDLLERILYAQFGISEKNWLRAMETIETGFTMAVSFVLKAQGKKLPPTATREEINKLLGGC